MKAIITVLLLVILSFSVSGLDVFITHGNEELCQDNANMAAPTVNIDVTPEITDSGDLEININAVSATGLHDTCELYILNPDGALISTSNYFEKYIVGERDPRTCSQTIHIQQSQNYLYLSGDYTVLAIIYDGQNDPANDLYYCEHEGTVVTATFRYNSVGECTPNWICEDYGTCANNLKERMCTDISCGIYKTEKTLCNLDELLSGSSGNDDNSGTTDYSNGGSGGGSGSTGGGSSASIPLGVNPNTDNLDNSNTDSNNNQDDVINNEANQDSSNNVIDNRDNTIPNEIKSNTALSAKRNNGFVIGIIVILALLVSTYTYIRWKK